MLVDVVKSSRRALPRAKRGSDRLWKQRRDRERESGQERGQEGNIQREKERERERERRREEMWTDRDRQLRQLRSCFQPPQPPSPLSFSLPPTISLYFYFPLTQKHTITATHTHTWRLHFQGHSVSSISPPCAVPCSGRLDKSNTNHALTNGTTKHPSRREDTHAYGDIAIENSYQ